jgi:UDP-glucose 4-epimerase
MRQTGIPSIAFASTSAIYGDSGKTLTEDSGPLFPISNYGAMKLASEGLLSAALESHLERVWIFRFPNVIGGRATHGVIYDLLGKLLRARAEPLEVLGDGTQQKPYLHVSDLLNAMLLIVEQAPAKLNYYNISGTDDGATVRYIAETVVETAAPGTPLRYTGGKRGWVGDVPWFRYSTEKLSALGWKPQLSSREAVRKAVCEVWAELSSCSLSS